MALGKVYYVDVVTDTCSIRCIVIVSEYAKLFQLAYCYLCDIWHQVVKKTYTVVIVTHNMQQAGRIADRTAFFLLGEIVEYDDTAVMFNTPHDKRTEDYITGRFG